MKHRTTSAVSLAVFSLQLLTPLTAVAAGCVVSGLDTVAGLGTQISVMSCGANLQTVLEMQSADHQIYTQNLTLDGAGNATTLIPSKYTLSSGQYGFTVAGKSGSFTVSADRADDAHSSVSATQQGNGNATVTALLRDRYDNPVAGRPLALIASKLTDEVIAQSRETDDAGRFIWTVHGSQGSTFTVYDVIAARQMKLQTQIQSGSRSPLAATLTGFEQGGDTAIAASDTTSFTDDAFIDHFEISMANNASSVKANELFSLTIRAMQGKDIARGYIGTLVVKSSDADADLPKKGSDPEHPTLGSVDMRGMDQGERSVPLAFVLRSGGSQTITFADAQDPSITGSITLNVSQSGTSAGKIVILDPKDRTSVKGSTILLQGRAPSLINLIVKGGANTVSGESDTEGVFRISVPLNPQDKEVTLFVASENGTYESEPVHLIIDTESAKIQTITISPDPVRATGTGLITVQSEAGLTSLTAQTSSQNLTLTEGSGATGIYTGILTAPAQDGVYDVTVTATDSVGNATTMLTKWTVKPKSLPTVQNVKAAVEAGTIKLSWDAVTGLPVSAYKIYIATKNEPNNYLYSVATKNPVTSAILKDLPGGTTYLFSLTALGEDGSESPEKSTPVSATPLGLSVTITAGIDSLLLQWTPLANLPLNRYILQYGTEPGVYPEQRAINGQATTYVMHDLINGVTYEVKLTPVAVTGKVMNELAVVLHGTPGGNGFTVGSSETVPTNILHSGAPLQPNIRNVPSNTGSGIPSMVLGLLVLAAFIGGLQWRKSKKQKLLAQQFLESMHQRYHS